MILDVRHESFRALIECSGEENIGQLTDLLLDVLEIDEQCQEATADPHESERVSHQYNYLKDLCANKSMRVQDVYAEYQRIKEQFSGLSVWHKTAEKVSKLRSKELHGQPTIWWVKKAIPRNISVRERFGKNTERTTIIVAIATENQATPPIIPPVARTEKSTEFIVQADSGVITTNQQQIHEIAIKRAKESENDRKILFRSDLEKLHKFQGQKLSAHVKSILREVCLADNPALALRKHLDGDISVRAFADELLLALGKAVKAPDGSVQLVAT